MKRVLKYFLLTIVIVLLGFFSIGLLHPSYSYTNSIEIDCTLEEAFEAAINSGAKDCSTINGIYEIITKKEDFYKIKTNLEKIIDSFKYSAIEWRPINYLNLDKEQSKKMVEILNLLEELDDVQNVFTNVNLNVEK